MPYVTEIYIKRLIEIKIMSEFRELIKISVYPFDKV